MGKIEQARDLLVTRGIALGTVFACIFDSSKNGLLPQVPTLTMFARMSDIKLFKLTLRA
jgi:hypothetical protein